MASLVKTDTISSTTASSPTVTLPTPTAPASWYVGRNIAINGAMQVSQRGTSESGVTTAQYADAPDRWYIQLNGAGTWTVSQSTTAPNEFSHSYKFDCTTADASLAAADRLYLAQKIEGQYLTRFAKGTADAKKYAISFWVRSSKTGTYIVGLWDADNARQCSQSYTISVADTWTQISLEFPADTTGAITYDNSQGMQLIFYLAAGTDYTSGSLSTTWEASDATKRAAGQVNVADSTSGDFYITGIQMEVGAAATPYEHKSYAQELQACERYYQIKGMGLIGGIESNSATVGTWRTGFTFHPEMRAAPTAAILSGQITYNRPGLAAHASISNTIAFSSGNTSLGVVMGIGNYNNSAVGSGGALGIISAGGNQFTFDAEL